MTVREKTSSLDSMYEQVYIPCTFKHLERLWHPETLLASSYGLLVSTPFYIFDPRASLRSGYTRSKRDNGRLLIDQEIDRQATHPVMISRRIKLEGILQIQGFWKH